MQKSLCLHSLAAIIAIGASVLTGMAGISYVPGVLMLVAAILVLGLGLRSCHLSNHLDSPLGKVEEVFTESDMSAFTIWAKKMAAGDWLCRDNHHAYPSWMESIATLEQFDLSLEHDATGAAETDRLRTAEAEAAGGDVRDARTPLRDAGFSAGAVFRDATEPELSASACATADPSPSTEPTPSAIAPAPSHA